MFTLCMVPRIAQDAYRRKREGLLGDTIRSTFTTETLRAFWRGKDQKEHTYKYIPIMDEEETPLKPDDIHTPETNLAGSSSEDDEVITTLLGLLPTARFALTFALMWFSANYFAISCLQYTTVASTTILTSTSSVWTLLIGALTQTEKFTWRKLCGVLGSLAGVILISQIDLQARNQGEQAATVAVVVGNANSSSRQSRRSINEFPDKSPYELALGDSLALFSAVLYGFYTISLKKTTVAAMPKSLHMPTFFGFVGLFNIIFLFPLFPILHFSGLERFELPPTSRIWTILLINAISSLLSDICWAYGMVLTSPLVAAVALSLTIPFSLVGEVLIQGRSESWIYWLGAFIVVGSFVFVEREGKGEDDDTAAEGVTVERNDDEEDFGEPGPAIVVEDYDEVMLRRGRSRERSSSPLLLVTEDDDEREEEHRVRH